MERAIKSPDTLYQLSCGLLRSLREANRAEVNILEDAEFVGFRGVLDGEMKRLNATGNYIEKQKARNHDGDGGEAMGNGVIGRPKPSSFS